MKRSSLIALLITAPLAVLAQTVVFTDTFGSSTTNGISTPGGTPTASSTSYDIASTKTSMPGTTIAANDLKLGLSATTGSGSVEAQALFTTTPVKLVTVGDYINLTFTFTNTLGGLLQAGTSSMDVGLYNSGGTAPLTNLFNSGLTTTAGSAYAVGGCSNWQGYVSQLVTNGGNCDVITRPQQNAGLATSSASQELLLNGAGSGCFLNPKGTQVGSTETSTLALTNGGTYTWSSTITLTGAGAVTITNNLYSGSSVLPANLLFSQTNATSGGNTYTNFANAFDGFAIGTRNGASSFNPVMDISKITITKSIFVAPGPMFSVTGGGAGCGSGTYPVGLSGSVATNVYYLYTNGVADGAVLPFTGNGLAFSFPLLQSTVATYTVLASNTVSSVTGLMSGSAAIAIVPGPCIAASPVFTDNFNSGSTTNGTSTPGGIPTASSTSYDLASSKTVTNSMAPGHFKVGLSGSTSDGFYEAQAVFAATPVTLATPGDYIVLTCTFTDATNLLAGTSSAIYAGLYDSGGLPPVAGSLANAGLNGTPGSVYAAGNCSNWLGYVQSIVPSGGNCLAYTRPSQNAGGTSSGNQELVGSNPGSGGYNSPAGDQLGSETSGVTLNGGLQYTFSCSITLTAAGTLTITNNLYDNNDDLIFSQTNTATGADDLTQSFDSLCIGVFNAGGSFDPVMDLNQITVSASVANSPGPVFDVTGGGSVCAGEALLVGLTGSVTADNYWLYTNNVFAGKIVSGLNSNNLAISFGPQTALATYTVLASNTVTHNTGPMGGSATISLVPAPVITMEPSPIFVATNSTGEFSVVCSGVALGYQWYRNGVGLTNGGSFSGCSSSNLVISPATTADAASAPQGYYCIINNTCGLSTISQTNSLTLQAPGSIVWQGGNPNTNWDLVTPNFTNAAGNSVVFQGGDNVTFDDSSTNPIVTLTSAALAPTSVNVTANVNNYVFTGSGELVGSGSLLMTGGSTLTISNANNYAGGTTISNGDVVVKDPNQKALGIGPVTLAGGELESGLSAGAYPAGLSNNLIVTASSTLQVDGTSTYALNLLGTLTGSPGAVLTIQSPYDNSSTADRVRLYGSFTNNASINLDTAGNEVDLALYNGSGLEVFNGNITGTGGRLLPRSGNGEILNGTNTFNDSGVQNDGSGPTGYSVVMSGGSLGLGADSSPDFNQSSLTGSSPVGLGNVGIDTTLGNVTLYASGGAHTIANELIYTSATNTVTLTIGGSNSFTWSGPIQLNGADYSSSPTNANRTIQINNTALTTFSGVVDDAGQGCGLIKTGTGALYLDGVNTYTGSNTVSSGLLAGIGTIAGPVTISSGAMIGGGDSTAIGTLTVNGNLTLGGNAWFKVNKSVSPSNDVIAVSGALTNIGAGTVTMTNLNPEGTLSVGDTFYLFNQAVSNSAALTVIGANVAWSNNLAANGSVVVVPSPDTGVQLAGPASVALGAYITNTVTLTNLGPGTALGMVVTDTLPANVAFVSASNGGTTNANAGQVVWGGFALAANTGTNFTLVVLATAGGSAESVATVESSALDPHPANNTATSVTVVTTTITPTIPPHIGRFTMSGLNVVISGTNGVNGGTYYLLESTNLAKPLSQWTPVATNVVNTNGANGAFTFTSTNVITSSLPQQFYIMSTNN